MGYGCVGCEIEMSENMTLEEKIDLVLDILKDSSEWRDRKCSITLGTASKGGEIKLYFNPLDPEGTAKIIKEAYDAFAMMKIHDSMVREGAKGL
jgi:hypothetical protein